MRELLPAMKRQDPSLDITLFHSLFAGASSAPPEEWMAEYRTEQLTSSMRSLYPSWALLGRPALPASLGDVDIVHSPSPAAVPPVSDAQRLIVTVHDIAFVVHPDLFPTRWRIMYRAALARAARSADAIITVSRHTAEDLLRHAPRRLDPDRIHVTPLAASLPSTDQDVGEVLARLKLPLPYILFVGTLEPRKNLVRLVRAYRRLAGRGAPHGLVLAGPIGWKHAALMAELSKDGPGEITLTGALGATDLDAIYRGAAAFAYPSLYEGFGLPVLEAMARGIPCVVSTSSSLPEVAGEAALPVDPRSTAALTEAMEQLTTDPSLADRLRQAGLQRAARFSWEETARRTLDVYKVALSR